MKVFLTNLAAVLRVGTRLGLGFMTAVLGLLAGSAGSTPRDDELSSSIRGGILNYRTGKFDEGTDPGGLYERD